MLKKFYPFLLLIVSVIFSLLLAELILRVFTLQPLYTFKKGIFTQSEEYGYCLSPFANGLHVQPSYTYTIKVNSWGFRGKEPNFNAGYRVLIVGDSYAAGQGVDEEKGLCEIASKHFLDRGQDIGIFNTSVFGYCLLNEIRVLRKFIPLYKPDLVIYLMYSNDFLDRKSMQVKDGYLVYESPGPVRAWLNTNSYLYCLIKRIFYKLKYYKGFSNIPKPAVFSQQDLDFTFGYLREMNRLCAQHGVRFIVVPLPDIEMIDNQAYIETRKYVFRLLQKDSICFDDWYPGIPRDRVKDLFYEYDLHWTEAGHAYFSDFLIRLIAGEKEKQPLRQ